MIKILSMEPLYQGFLKVTRLVVEQQKPDGTWTKPFNWEICERGPAVGVLLFDPDLDRVVLVEQHRFGAAASGKSDGLLLETVAGMVKPGEDPAEVAKREAQEEAGLAVQEIIRIGDYFPSAGGLSEHITLFVGRVDASAAGGHHGLEAENEFTRVVSLDRSEAYQMALRGDLRMPMVLMALFWLHAQPTPPFQIV